MIRKLSGSINRYYHPWWHNAHHTDNHLLLVLLGRPVRSGLVLLFAFLLLLTLQSFSGFSSSTSITAPDSASM